MYTQMIACDNAKCQYQWVSTGLVILFHYYPQSRVGGWRGLCEGKGERATGGACALAGAAAAEVWCAGISPRLSSRERREIGRSGGVTVTVIGYIHACADLLDIVPPGMCWAEAAAAGHVDLLRLRTADGSWRTASAGGGGSTAESEHWTGAEGAEEVKGAG